MKAAIDRRAMVMNGRAKRMSRREFTKSPVADELRPLLLPRSSAAESSLPARHPCRRTLTSIQSTPLGRQRQLGRPANSRAMLDEPAGCEHRRCVRTRNVGRRPRERCRPTLRRFDTSTNCQCNPAFTDEGELAARRCQRMMSRHPEDLVTSTPPPRPILAFSATSVACDGPG